MAYVRFSADGSSEIHIMNADGTEDRQLTSRPGAGQILPTWSPDGSRLTFASATRTETQIFRINSDGTGLRQLTNDPSGRPNDPVWSPDGALIAFDAGDPTPALYVMNPDGDDPHRLTSPDGQLRINWPLMWSPDGAFLAFAGAGPTGQRDIYVVRRDGGELRNLTKDRSDKSPPAWSPDGRLLAFWSDLDGDGDIYAISSDGGSRRRLTTGSHLTGMISLAWSPDGRQLAVWSEPEGQPGTIHLLDAEGGELRRLSTEPAYDSPAVWRPQG